MNLERFTSIRVAVVREGYGGDIAWSEQLQPPANAEDFATEAVFVICNSGMKHTIAVPIFNRVLKALSNGQSAAAVFGHVGKAAAIDRIWGERQQLFVGYLQAADKLAYCEQLPWVGPVTKYHLAKNLGADVAKPDVHLTRLAKAEGCSVQELCERLATMTGLRVATVDVILWRACAVGIVDSRRA